MSAAPAAVINALASLLDAEQNSVFRFMGEGSPYLSRATAEIRKPLAEMVAAGQERVMALASEIEQLGGIPSPSSIEPEEQYLAYLTFAYLLPRLIDAKKRIIEQYERAIPSLRSAPADVMSLVQSYLSQHRKDLATLSHARA